MLRRNDCQPRHALLSEAESCHIISCNSSLQDRSVANGDISAPTQSESLPKESPLSNSQYQELVRLINLQREKLTTQHAEMTQVLFESPKEHIFQLPVL